MWSWEKLGVSSSGVPYVFSEGGEFPYVVSSCCPVVGLTFSYFPPDWLSMKESVSWQDGDSWNDVCSCAILGRFL